MYVSEVLRRKPGSPAPVTVSRDATVNAALDLLAEHGIGALVVSDDGSSVAGMVSERDVVRRLQSDGVEVLARPVSAIMTAKVLTCRPDDDLDRLAVMMTEHHIRHVPVVDGELLGVVSIGDVVKNRLDELQAERDQLVGYING